MRYKEIGYHITTAPYFLDEQNAITPHLSDKLPYYHDLALDGKPSSVKKIKKAIQKHPKNPQLKNYLSTLYNNLDRQDKAFEVNRWILREHPNYLYGKLNLAAEYYEKEEYHKIPEILGPDLELKALYPDRDTFHLNEVLSFFRSTVLYFAAIGDFEQANIRHEIMSELAPDALETQIAKQHILKASLKAGMERYEEAEAQKITVQTKVQTIKTTRQAPTFHHQEIDWLYSNELYISKTKLDAILALPRTTLLQDLELIVQDSIDHYGYFAKQAKENNWGTEKTCFAIHALYILGERKATDCLDAFFVTLSQSDEFVHFYFDDFITMLWEPLYKMATSDLEAC